MAYSPIRRHFRRFAHLLNEVKVPRLVVVDMADDTNTLVTVERTTTSTNGYSSYMAAASQPAASAPASDSAGGDRQLTLTGLQDWSNCVFGDPLLATVFSDGVSESFMEGFETGPTTNANDLSSSSSSRNTSTHSTNTAVMSITAITEQITITPAPTISSPPPAAAAHAARSSTSSDDISSLIEDLPNASIRLLLYQVQGILPTSIVVVFPIHLLLLHVSILLLLLLLLQLSKHQQGTGSAEKAYGGFE
ncbi:hypothetical protein N0V85_000163 [Neurospora sp. IMI 360204]|nr:hypothetical protein N0V85_000163 [Neurospora sp. IMI 360204]